MIWFREVWFELTQWLGGIRWQMWGKWLMCLVFGTVLPVVGGGMLFKGLETLCHGTGWAVVGLILMGYAYVVARIIPQPWK